MGRDGDRRYEDTVDQMRRRFKEQCLPVFYFSDGQIMFLDSRDQARAIARRCEQQLRRMQDWAIVDSDGITHSSSGEEDDSVWYPTELEGLRFESDD